MNERDRVHAALLLRVQFGEINLGSRWEQLLVTEPMLRTLRDRGILCEVLSEDERRAETLERERLSNGLVLFDLREKTYPNKRGDVFRSLQVFECWVCLATTNCVIMGGWPGYGIRAVCPNSAECWHHEIEEKIKWSKKPHPASHKAELEEEVRELREVLASLASNDIKGSPDTNQKRVVTNTLSHRRGSSCRHWFQF